MIDLNIYQRINEVRKKVEYLHKEKNVDNKYNVVTHDQVTAELRQYLIEFGIAIIPSLISSTLTKDMVKFGDLYVDGKKVGKNMIPLYAATYCFEFVNIDNPKDKVVTTFEAHAVDTADKAPAKAISIAQRVVMLKMFNIETGENEESTISGRIENERFNQNVINELLEIASEKGLDALAEKWKEMSEEDRSSVGRENFTNAKAHAIVADKKRADNDK